MWVAEVKNNVLFLGTHALLKSIKNEWAYHSMFVRCDDATMVDQLFGFLKQKISKFALSGTPGIGKTMIRNYLVWRLVQQLKKSGTPTVIALHSSGDGAGHDVLALEFHRMQENGFPSLSVSLWDPQTFQTFMDETTEVDFIQLNDISKGDSSALRESSNTVLRVRISSENDNSYKEWMKATQKPPAVHLHMFPWSIEDLKAARIQCAPEVQLETLNLRFHKYGGIPRVVFTTEEVGDSPRTFCAVCLLMKVRSLFAGRSTIRFRLNRDGHHVPRFRHSQCCATVRACQKWKGSAWHHVYRAT